jgi:hypothetical protein
MELVRLACNGCGADIEVTEDARFVTCRYCDAKLEVKHTEGATFTAVREAVKRVERVEKKTREIEDEVAELRAENDLLELEHDWEEQRKDLMLKAKDGTLTEPSRTMAFGVGIGAFVIGVALMILVPTQGILIGLGFAGFGCLGAFLLHAKAVTYEAAVAEYEARRAAIVDRAERSERD